MQTTPPKVELALLALLIASLGLTACSEVTGLGDRTGILGTFVLQSVGGAPLPVRGTIDQIPTTAEILADTLVILDRRWEQSRHIRSGDLDGGGEFLAWVQLRSGPITRLEDGRFMLGSLECDDTGDCLPNEVFEARGDTLLIDITADFLFRDLRFVRIHE